MIISILELLLIGAVSAQFKLDDFLRPVILNEEGLNKVHFHLYTRNNSAEGIELDENNSDQIVETDHVKIIVHGWINDVTSDWVKSITEEYLRKDAYNVIQVDWSETAHKTYSEAVDASAEVGARIGELISMLYRNRGIPLSNFHLIGHSLGAHVAGYAGKSVYNITGSRIARISAMDASSPLFEPQDLLTYEGLERLVSSTALKDDPSLTSELLRNLSKSPTFERLRLLNYDGLKETDADIVDAIHTDACQVGFKGRLGAVDFYPNGGTPVQPGCRPCPSKPKMLDLINMSKIIDCLTCSHYISTWYFIDSINNGNFVGTKCSSWNKYKSGGCDNDVKVLMGDGYKPSAEATGKFYLRTNSKAPYAQDA